jgi:predicted dehydrogenase
VYTVHFLYGNGTARDARGSWRDRGMGVLSDLGSHLLDLVIFLFGPEMRDFEVWAANAFENDSYDHILFGIKGKPSLQLEATMLSWRNSFSLNIIGELGSAHIDGLCKWGPSTFIVRERRLPSGKPDEERSIVEMADPTWELEYEYFKKRCQALRANLDSDRWINSALQAVALQAAALQGERTRL